MIGKDSLTLEEVKAELYTRELRQKATGDNENHGSGLVVRLGKNSRKMGLTIVTVLVQMVLATLGT